jgi:hypothetical protein
MSLGYRPRNDHIADRPSVASAAKRAAPPLPVAEPVCEKKGIAAYLTCANCVPRGFLPVLLLSAAFFVVPTLMIYETYDFTDDAVRATFIGGSAVVGLLAILANDCCCWYNMILFFHTAIEVKVIDVALTFAYADGTSDAHMALSIAAAVTIILHLIPFYLTDYLMPLLVLAYAGVVVNVATLVYLDSSRLLLTGASAMALLVVTMIIGGICEIRTSMLSLLRKAITECKWVTCGRFEL